MNLKINLSAAQVVIILSIIAVILVVSSLILGFVVVSQTIDTGSTYDLFNAMNVDDETNIPTWYSSIILATAGLLLLLNSSRIREMKEKYTIHWFLLGLIFLALSIEESADIRGLVRSLINLPSSLRDSLGTSGLFYFSWIVPAIILMIIVALFFFKFFLHLPRRIKLLFFLGGALYIVGAVGMEAIGGLYLDGQALDLTAKIPYDIPYLILVHIEETLEMVGVIVFIYALLGYFE